MSAWTRIDPFDDEQVMPALEEALAKALDELRVQFEADRAADPEWWAGTTIDAAMARAEQRLRDWLAQNVADLRRSLAH